MTAWPTERLGRLARLRVSNVDKKSVEGERDVLLCNYTDVYNNEIITSDLDFMIATATASQARQFGLRAGDTVFTKDSETADDIGVPAFVADDVEDLVCGYHLAIASPERSAVDPRYLYWAMASAEVRQQWTVLASGVTRVGLRSDDMTKVAVPVPPLDEQRRIADFLDTETARLDQLQDFRERQADLLAARRFSLAEDLLERERRGSRSIPLKYLVREVDSRDGPLGELLSVSIHFGVVPRSATTDDLPRADDLDRYKRVLKGDLVLNRMRAFQGGVGVAPVSGIVSPDYTVMRARSGIHPRFLHHVFRSPWFVGEMTARLRGIGSSDQGNVRTPRVSFADLGGVEIPAPERSQQDELVRRLDSEDARVRAIEDATRRQVTTLIERRQAFITAAVTGQIDVTTVRVSHR